MATERAVFCTALPPHSFIAGASRSAPMASRKDTPPNTSVVFGEAAKFTNRHRRSLLLEQMTTADDYDILFEGLRFFTLKLQCATYLPDDEAKITAIDAAAQLAALFKYSEDLTLPFLHIQDALRHGAPVIKPTRRKGRPRLLDEQAILHGYVAATVDRLISTGMSQKKAWEEVARGLRSVQSHRGLTTPRTVRGWCEEVSADVGRHGTAAWVYHDMTTGAEGQKFSNLETVKAKRAYALKSLAGYVLMHFKKPT